MATPPSQAAQEAGAGGKFRKRPFRRTPATPYDRPPTAARAAVAAASAAARNESTGGAAGSGWRSKIVDPFSRIVARSASKFFDSVFRKRLTAPPDLSENKHAQRKEVLDGLCDNSPSGVQEQNFNKGINPISAHGTHMPLHASESTIDGNSELEQLLRQKMFTRAEFDRLTELLRSRTVEPSSSKDLNPERNEDMIISIGKNKEKQPVIEQNILQSTNMHDIMTMGNLSEVETMPFVRSHGNNTSPSVGLTLRNQILEEEAASPAEIAKAYMGSRSSNGFPASLGIRHPKFEEDISLCNSTHTKKPLYLSVAPNSSVSSAAASSLAKSRHINGRLHDKSSIYKMSRSPFFKAQKTSNDGRSLLGHHIESSTSRELALMNIMQSDGKHAKKRGSSVLDDDIGPLVSARRVRQKSYIMPTSRYLGATPRQFTPISSLGKDVHRYHEHLKQKLDLDDRGHRVANPIVESISSMGFLPIHPQSSQMAKKILEQLDKLMPSPKEISPKLEAARNNESPSKLTPSMLHGRALKSMEDIDSSRFLSTDSADDLDGSSDMHQQSIRSSILQKQDISEKHSPSNPSESGYKQNIEAVHFDKNEVCAADVKSSTKSAAFATLDVCTSEQKPAFRISAPEDFLDVDDDDDEGDYDVKEPPKADIVLHEKARFVEDESTKAERKMQKPDESLSGGVPATLKLQNSEKAFEIPKTERDNGFLVSAAPTSNSSLPLSSQLSVPTTIFKGLDSENEKIADSSFKFSSGEAHEFAPSSNTFALSGSPLNVDGSTAPKIQSDGIIMDTGGKNQKGVGLASSFGTSASSAFSSSTSSDVKSFGAAATFSPISVLATTLSSGSSSTAPEISFTTSSISSGTGNSLSVFTAATSSTSNYVSANAEEGSVKLPFFGISSVTPSLSAAISSTGSNSSEFTNSSVISTINDSASSPKPVLFSSTNIVSAQPISSRFPSTANGVFAFGASPSSGDKAVSSPSSSSQSLLTSFGNTVGRTESGSGGSIQLSESSSSPANSSMMFGSNSSSSSASSTSSLSTKSLGSASIYSFSASPGSSSFVSGSSTSFAPMTASGSSSGFSFSTSAVSSSTFGSSNFVIPTFGSSSSTTVAISSSSSGSNTSAANVSSPHINQNFQTSSSSTFSSSFSSSSSGVGVSSSISGSSTLFAASSSSPQFNPSFQTSPSSPFGSLVSTTSSPSTGFASASSTSSSGSSLFTFGASSASSSGSSHFTFGASSALSSGNSHFTFGASSAPSSGNSHFTFGASSAPALPFTSPGSTPSSMMTPAQPVFGMKNQFSGMNSVSPGNDQMNVEDSMADEPVQSSFNPIPAFGQPTTASSTPFSFGSSNTTGGSSVFQFGKTQSNSFSQNPSPFQPAGSLEFSAGGSFSLGSADDKSGRKIVKVRRDRDKYRKK